jgi:arsenate reductase-like glutaredoxin family protein
MIYLYTNENCPKCEDLKQLYKQTGVRYIELSANRLKTPENEIDREALIEASMRNMELPVIVEVLENGE